MMTTLRCPVCDQRFDSSQSDSLPFCSPRCRQIDLGRWLSEEYGLPYERLDEEAEWEGEDHEA